MSFFFRERKGDHLTCRSNPGCSKSRGKNYKSFLTFMYSIYCVCRWYILCPDALFLANLISGKLRHEVIECWRWTKTLQVSVPYSSLLDIVTIRCGRCANLWSINMAAAFQSLSSSSSSASSSSSSSSWPDLHNHQVQQDDPSWSCDHHHLSHSNICYIA